MFTEYDDSNMPADGTPIELTQVEVYFDITQCELKATMRFASGVVEYQTSARVIFHDRGKKSRRKEQVGLVSMRFQVGKPRYEGYGTIDREGFMTTYTVWVLTSEANQALEAGQRAIQSHVDALRKRLKEMSFVAVVTEA